jgi:hypothetical protein
MAYDEGSSAYNYLPTLPAYLGGPDPNAPPPPAPAPQSNPLWAGIKFGAGQFLQSIPQTAEAVGKVIGSPTLEQGGAQLAANVAASNLGATQNRPDIQSQPWFGTGLSGFLRKAAFTGGAALPTIAGIAGVTAATGPGAAVPLLERAGLGAVGTTGIATGAAIQTPQAIAKQYESAKEQPGGATTADAARSLLFGPPLGITESIVPASGATRALTGTVGTLGQRVLGSGIANAAAGAIGGGLQSVADNAFRSDKSVTQKAHDIVNSVIESGGVGGAMGAVFGLRRENPAALVNDPRPVKDEVDRVLALPAPPIVPPAPVRPVNPNALPPDKVVVTTGSPRGVEPVEVSTSVPLVPVEPAEVPTSVPPVPVEPVEVPTSIPPVPVEPEAHTIVREALGLRPDEKLPSMITKEGLTDQNSLRALVDRKLNSRGKVSDKWEKIDDVLVKREEAPEPEVQHAIQEPGAGGVPAQSPGISEPGGVGQGVERNAAPEEGRPATPQEAVQAIRQEFDQDGGNPRLDTLTLGDRQGHPRGEPAAGALVPELRATAVPTDIPDIRTQPGLGVTHTAPGGITLAGRDFSNGLPAGRASMRLSAADGPVNDPMDPTAFDRTLAVTLAKLPPDIAARVKIYNSADRLPPEMLQAAAANEMHPNQIRGGYDTDTGDIHISRAGIQSPEDLQKTIAEEVFHKQVSELPNRRDYLADVAGRAGGIDGMLNIANKYGKRDELASYMPVGKVGPIDQVEIADEMLAKLHSDTAGTLKAPLMEWAGKFKQAFVATLRSMGLNQFADRVGGFSTLDAMAAIHDIRTGNISGAAWRSGDVLSPALVQSRMALSARPAASEQEQNLSRMARYTTALTDSLPGGIPFKAASEKFGKFMNDKTSLYGLGRWVDKDLPQVKSLVESHRSQGMKASRSAEPFINALTAKSDFIQANKPWVKDAFDTLIFDAERGINGARPWEDHEGLSGRPNSKDYYDRWVASKEAWNKLGQVSREGVTGQQIYKDLVSVHQAAWYAKATETMENLIKPGYTKLITPDEVGNIAVTGFHNDPSQDFLIASQTPMSPTTFLDFHQKEFNQRVAGLLNYMKTKNTLVDAGNKPDAADLPLRSLLAQIAQGNPQLKVAPYFHSHRTGEYIVSMHLPVDKNGVILKDAYNQFEDRMNKAGFGDVRLDQLAEDKGHVYVRLNSLDAADNLAELAKLAQNDGILDKKSIRTGLVNSEAGNEIAPKFLQQLVSKATEHPMFSGMSQEDKDAFVQELRALALDVLPDNSIQKTLTERKGTSGGSTDTARNMAAYGSIFSNAYGHMTSFRDRQNILASMKTKVRDAQEDNAYTQGQRRVLQRVSDEVMLRERQGTWRGGQNWADWARAVNHSYRIALSPVYTTQLASQMWLLALPEMAKVTSFAKAALALGSSTTKGLAITKAIATNRGGLDARITPEALKAGGANDFQQRVLMHLANAGDLEMGGATRGLNMVANQGTGVGVQKALHVANTMGIYSEVATRVIPALAAMRVAQDKGMNFDQTVTFTRHILDEGMQVWGSWNQPRFFSPKGPLGSAGKIVGAFHGYQTQLFEKLYTEAADAMGRSGVVSQKEAQRFLLAHMGGAIAAAGVLGLPAAGWLAGAASKVSSAFNEGEEYDFEAHFSRFVKDLMGEQAGAIALRGLPRSLGVDTSSWGDADLVPGTKFMEDRRKFEDAYSDYLAHAAGAPLSLAQNWYVGARDIGNGQVLKGMKEFLPSSAAHLIDAYRVARGANGESAYVDSKGVPMPGLRPSGVDILKTALGFKPGELADYEERQHAATGATQNRSFHSQVIMQNFANAMRQGDQEGVRSAVQDAVAYDRDPAHLGMTITQQLLPYYQRQQMATAQAAALEVPSGVSIKHFPDLQLFGKRPQ